MLFYHSTFVILQFYLCYSAILPLLFCHSTFVILTFYFFPSFYLYNSTPVILALLFYISTYVIIPFCLCPCDSNFYHHAYFYHSTFVTKPQPFYLCFFPLPLYTSVTLPHFLYLGYSFSAILPLLLSSTTLTFHSCVTFPYQSTSVTLSHSLYLCQSFSTTLPF